MIIPSKSRTLKSLMTVAEQKCLQVPQQSRDEL